MKPLAVVFLMLAALANAAPPSAKVTGGGAVVIGIDTSEVAFHAMTEKKGDGVKGQGDFHIVTGGIVSEFHVDVDCLAISGNQAWLGGVITESTDPALPIGTRVTWSLIDNGQGHGARDLVSLPSREGVSCEQQPAFPQFVLYGNVKIH
jgi:hypothetical protein